MTPETIATDANEILNARAAARWAGTYLRLRLEGKDPAQVAQEMLIKLVRTLRPTLPENIRVTGHGIEMYEEPRAASLVLSYLVEVLPESAQFLAELY